MEEEVIRPYNLNHQKFLNKLETILQNNNRNNLDHYIEKTIIHFYKNFVPIEPFIITFDGNIEKEITNFDDLFQYADDETISEYCGLCIKNFANFMMAYCVYFLNNSIDKNSIYYKLAYYGFIQLIVHFNSLDYVLDHNTDFNIHVLSDNREITERFYQEGACYFHSILMYFYFQDYNPIKNLIYKDIKKIFNMENSVIVSMINGLQLLPYLWLASVVFWREFGIGYYSLTNIFYNKFLNMFSWYGGFFDRTYYKPTQNGNQKIDMKIDNLITCSTINEYTSRQFDVEYKTTTDETTTGLYIYLSFRDFKFTFNNALSVTINFDGDRAHAIVMDFYQKYNSSPIRGRIYDSNYGVENFECSFNYKYNTNVEHCWYIFIKSTPIIKRYFDRPVEYIRTTNLFMNYFTFKLEDIHLQNRVLFNILDCNLDNNIITYQQTKLYNDNDLIIELKKINETFLPKMKNSLANAYNNITWLKIVNGNQFEIKYDIPNFISNYTIISKESIIERIEYFMNNNKFYINKTYLLIESVINQQKKYYLYIDNGLYFDYADIYEYTSGIYSSSIFILITSIS